MSCSACSPRPASASRCTAAQQENRRQKQRGIRVELQIDVAKRTTGVAAAEFLWPSWWPDRLVLAA